MSLSAVDAAVRARLATWPNVGEVEVRVLNDIRGDTPPGNTPFLVIQYPVATASQITFGAPGLNFWRDEGAIRFVLNVETGSGANQALAWMEEIAALFRGKTLDGVRTYAPTSPVIDDRNDEAGWFKLSFSVPFDHDVIG